MPEFDRELAKQNGMSDAAIDAAATIKENQETGKVQISERLKQEAQNCSQTLTQKDDKSFWPGTSNQDKVTGRDRGRVNPSPGTGD